MNTYKNLTENEHRALMVLIDGCLAGMGGEKPSDLLDDMYTWIDAGDLIAEGWSKEAAAGTLGSLEQKGMVYLAGEDSSINLHDEEFTALDPFFREYEK